jgi:putative PIN family toxin of toxin-antitoxin system
LNDEFDILLSNEVLLEYTEVIAHKMGEATANNTLRTLLNLPNATLITPFYNWNLIHQDEDDNKFVDCAVAGNAHYIITNDKHFNILRQIDFPKVNILSIDEFHQLLKT